MLLDCLQNLSYKDLEVKEKNNKFIETKPYSNEFITQN